MSNDPSSAAGRKLREAKRIVIKVGSAILYGDDGVRQPWLLGLANDIAAFVAKDVEIVVVTSGAIAIGRGRLGLKRALRLDEKQAASAAGQAALLQSWQTAFDVQDVPVAQLLLTLDDMEDRRRYLNARATFRTLLNLGAIPVVNENDTVATSEIRYGDNDRLAAHVAQLVEADLLVILSDVDGVYSADPRADPAAVRFDEITEITADIESIAVGPNPNAGIGTGGMESKIAAAKIAGRNGCATIIAPGHVDHPLVEIANGGPATLIHAVGTIKNARQKWIGGRLKPSGSITVDDGAAKALQQGASLLPAGVIKSEGDFSRGDAVSILGTNGEVIGQGLSSYDSGDVLLVAGRKSDDIEALLGYSRRPAIIEKNDLSLRRER